MAGYKKGILENSAKMVLFFHIVEESVMSGDKVLVFRYINLYTCTHSNSSDSLVSSVYAFFLLLTHTNKQPLCSQSLSTLTVIEEFLVKRMMPDYSGSGVKQTWVRNVNYYSKLLNNNNRRLLCFHVCHLNTVTSRGKIMALGVRS